MIGQFQIYNEMLLRLFFLLAIFKTHISCLKKKHALTVESHILLDVLNNF